MRLFKNEIQVHERSLRLRQPPEVPDELAREKTLMCVQRMLKPSATSNSEDKSSNTLDPELHIGKIPKDNCHTVRLRIVI